MEATARIREGPWSAASLLPDPDRAASVRLGFEAIANRRVTKAVVLEELTNLGLTTTSGKAVPMQTFGKLLENPIYTGKVVVPKWDIDVEGDFDPLITEELLQAVQRDIQRAGAISPGSHLRDHRDFPLHRAVKCGRCGSPLTASWSTGRRKRYGYYRCPRRGCGGCSVRKEQLERLFVGELESVRSRPEVLPLMAAVVEDVWREETSSARVIADRLRRRVTQPGAKQDRLVDAYLDGRGIDQDTYQRQAERIKRELADVQAQLGRLRLLDTDLGPTMAFAQALLADLPGCWNPLNLQDRPQFVRAIYQSGLIFDYGELGTMECPGG